MFVGTRLIIYTRCCLEIGKTMCFTVYFVKIESSITFLVHNMYIGCGINFASILPPSDVNNKWSCHYYKH